MAAKTGTLWEHSFESASLNHGFASIAANYIVEAVAGYIGTDNTAKTVYFRSGCLPQDCAVHIPLPDGELVITIQDGKRSVVCSEGYAVIYTKKAE